MCAKDVRVETNASSPLRDKPSEQFRACVAGSVDSLVASPLAKHPITSGTQAMREIERNLL